MKLKMEGSEIVVEGPRCSLRTRKVYSDLSVDYLKMFLLNVPATVIALGLFFFLDDLTGFEITYLLEVMVINSSYLSHFNFKILSGLIQAMKKATILKGQKKMKAEPMRFILRISSARAFSFIFTWFAAVPLIVWLALSLTNAIVKDFLILKGPCPNCGTENTSFFGTILSISSGGSINNVKCSNCGTEMVYDSSTRMITLPEGSKA
ncbi:hypothetical protein K1719_041436 [Acacia pycnantha]|nr:hypothetical protein K1719_041436 [Acacia pycnantha]